MVVTNAGVVGCAKSRATQNSVETGDKHRRNAVRKQLLARLACVCSAWKRPTVDNAWGLELGFSVQSLKEVTKEEREERLH